MKPSVYGTANRVYTLDNLFAFVLSHPICEHMDYVCLVYTPRRIFAIAGMWKHKTHLDLLCTRAHPL